MWEGLPFQRDQRETRGPRGEGNESGSHSQVGNTWLGLGRRTQHPDAAHLSVSSRRMQGQPAYLLPLEFPKNIPPGILLPTNTYARVNVHTSACAHARSDAEREHIPGEGLLV